MPNNRYTPQRMGSNVLFGHSKESVFYLHYMANKKIYREQRYTDWIEKTDFISRFVERNLEMLTA